MMKILSGKEVAENLKKDLILRIKKLERSPSCVLLLNAQDSSSLHYVKSQMKLASSLGIQCKIIEIDEKNVFYKDEIYRLNEKEDVDGILITRPLCGKIKEKEILEILSPFKDLDAINPFSMGKIFMSDSDFFAPATAEAVILMLEYYKVDMDYKNALVVGRSVSVGKPSAMLLLDKNATVTIAHSHTKSLKTLLKNADIIVAAVGKAEFLDTADMNENAVVIDCGIHYLEDRIVGDVKITKDIQMCSKVPGGVGPITSMLLMKHVVDCYEKKYGR